MSTHHISSICLTNPNEGVKGKPLTEDTRAAYLAELDVRENALLRIGNGIRDEVVFPRLREMGVAEADLHIAAMRLVRHVQYGLDINGSVAKFLGVIRLASPAHGTVATSEVA